MIEIKLCECGCGNPIIPHPCHKYKKRPVRFITGHFQRTAEFLETRKAMVLQPPEGFAPTGFCECGCGEKTPIAKQSFPKRNMYAGYPVRFIHNHHRRGLTGSASSNWKGGRYKDALGYWRVLVPGHHLADKNGMVKEHRLVWEQANGRRLKPGEHVHHIDGNKDNNDPTNLVAISAGAHMRLHNSEREHQNQIRRLAKDLEVRRKLSLATTQQWKNNPPNRKKTELSSNPE